MAKATKDKKDKFEISSILRTTYRRGGLVFPPGVSLTKSRDDLTEEQWVALEEDSRIVIKGVDIKATPKKATPKKVTPKKVTPKKAATKKAAPPKPESRVESGAGQGAGQKVAETK